MNKPDSTNLSLSGLTVVEHAQGVAACYTGRLLAVMGANVIKVEAPEQGSEVRRHEPLDPSCPQMNSLFEYLCVNKKSVTCDLTSDIGQKLMRDLLSKADILLDDTPVLDRPQLGLDPKTVEANHPGLIYVSILPFGAQGSHSHYRGYEMNLFHSGGEGFLLPNGLALELFPDRPPIKAYGHFAEMIGGVSAASAALAALFVRPRVGGQFVDVAIQDANVALSAFTVQRYGDGILETRPTRSFKYGGVLECADGHVQVLTLEQRQWEALVELMGRPDWAMVPELQDPLERGRRGSEINKHLRAWAKQQKVEETVKRGQELGVPISKYRSPEDVLASQHLRARELFAPIELPHGGPVEMLVAPFKLSKQSPKLFQPAPDLGANNEEIWSGLLGHSDEDLQTWRREKII